MIIDRIKAKQVFHKYVENYNSSDEKIKLKIEHTYRVCELCEQIAESLKLSQEEIDLAWLLGLLHDIGRFEQVKRYGTFNDAQSINHGKLGVEILFNEGKIRDFIDDDFEDELIRDVIDCHNDYRIPKELSERIVMFSNILRDADKVDIFKVNTIVPLETIYNVTQNEILNSEISPAVFNSFKYKDTILRKLKKTAADTLVGQISLVFGLVYDESIRITAEQGYLEKLMNFKFHNKDTQKKLEQMRDFVHKYIDEKLNT